MMSNIERILAGDKEALVNEFATVATWARNLSDQDWHNATHDSDGGLNGVIGRIVEKNVTTGVVAANKIYGICTKVTQITDTEVQELREIAQAQMEYHNPLKMATTASENARGRHNQAVLGALLNLKAVIESGESI